MADSAVGVVGRRVVLSANAQVRVYLCTAPMDMRKGFDSLASLVDHTLKLDPVSGHWFVFRNRKGDRVKVLCWDGSGLVLYYKRLDQGVFHWPRLDRGVITLTPSELSLLIDGMDWRRLAKTQIVKPQKIA